MENDKIFTIMVTGVNHDVRTFVSDCSVVLAHKLDSDEFETSLNLSANNATKLMLVMALDRMKQDILDSDPELKGLYEYAQEHKGDEDA